MQPSRVLYINSTDRDSGGSSSSGSINLGNFNLRGVQEVRLLESCYANSIYNVRSGVNNVLNWTDNGAVARTVTVTPGNYDVTDLVSALNTGMQAIDPTNLVAYSAITGKITITCGTNITLTFGTNSTGSIAPLIGFTLADTSAATSHTGANVINLSGPTHLYLRIKELTQMITSTDQDEAGHSFQLPLSEPFGSMIYTWQNLSYEESVRFEAPKVVTRLTYDFQLPGGELANLNGAEWSLKLEVFFGYLTSSRN